jgi:hypothetical protein
MEDKVNHPKHYTQGKIEVIDFILDQKMGYLDSNILKYLCRYRWKNGLEDLKKAQWYLAKLISEYEKEVAEKHTYDKDSSFCVCGIQMFDNYCTNRDCKENK